MITEVVASAIISIGGSPTHGASETALYVAQEAEKGLRRLEDSYTFGMAGKGVLSELLNTAHACREPNWDGYNAAPVTNSTYHLTEQLLRSLPLGIAPPTIGAEPDGQLTLEWHHSPRRTLSLSISPEGDLHYAALIGTARAFGTEPFYGDVPTIVIDLIRRVIVG